MISDDRILNTATSTISDSTTNIATRSTASAFITACLHNPEAAEQEIAAAIRAASPTASPNKRLVAHADALLGRNGRMNHAVESIGRGSAAMEAQAFSIPSTYPAARRS